ncbi:MAG: ATP-binding cassette domain-containing protein [Candidatus Hadarchaeales archaeon]
MKQPAVVAEKLTKRYGTLIAVNEVSLRIKEGEFFGLLGPNGAGKTTFIHMLTTILPPTSGTAKIFGMDIKEEKDEVRKLIGIVFQDQSLDNRLTGRENLDFHGRLYGIPKAEREKRIDEVLDLLELKNRANDLVQHYSGGMKRRLELARGLLHHPGIMFLDEPTLGLDAQTRRVIWDYIEKLNRDEKITMLLTTHYIEEADYLCERVGIIDHGKIIALGAPDSLKKKLRGDIVSLEVAEPQRYLKIFQKMKMVKEARVIGNRLYLKVDNGENALPMLIEFVRKNGGNVQSAGVSKPTLEDVFIKHTGRQIREEEPKGKGIGPGMHGWR